MLSPALKKLAQEHQLHCAHGIAYGSLAGYSVTLRDGAGTKTLAVTTRFPDQSQYAALQADLAPHDLQKEYRVQQLIPVENGIVTQFTDNPGTMKKIRAFIDWFFPLLAAHGATGSEICPQCGQSLTQGSTWQMVDGVAYHLHPGCAQQMDRSISMATSRAQEEDTGSYARGLLGALLGAIVGALVWALVLNLGYIAAIVGCIIGWLAERGYRLLHGKKGKGKIVILILSVLLGVLLGTFAADAFTLMKMISGGELPGWTYGEIPTMLSILLTEDSEFLRATLSDLGLGLLFAYMGAFALLHRSSKEVATTKVQKLD